MWHTGQHREDMEHVSWVYSFTAECYLWLRRTAAETNHRVHIPRELLCRGWEAGQWIGVCLLVGCLTSQQHASVSQGWICSDNFTAATLRWKLRIKPSTSFSYSILRPDRPVPALTLYRQAPGRVATGVPMFKSLV